MASAMLVSAPGGDVQVRLDAVAGRDEHGSTRAPVLQQGRRRTRGRTLGEATEQIEIRRSVRHGDAEQHPPMVRNEWRSACRSSGDRASSRRCRGGPSAAPAVGGWRICLPPSSHPLSDGRTSTSALVTALRGQRPERTPVWFMRQAGRSLPEYRALRVGTAMLDACLDPELASEITLQPVRRHGVDAAVFFSDIVIPLRLAGVPVEIVPGSRPGAGVADPLGVRHHAPAPDRSRRARADPRGRRAHGRRAGHDAAHRVRRGTLHARLVPRRRRTVQGPAARTQPDGVRPARVGAAAELVRRRLGRVPAGAGGGRCERGAAVRLVGRLAVAQRLPASRRTALAPHPVAPSAGWTCRSSTSASAAARCSI